MNREALVLYLQNIKNLELIAYTLKELKSMTIKAKQILENSATPKTKRFGLGIFSTIATVFSALVLLSSVLLWLNYDRVINSGETYIGFFLFMGCRVLPVILLIFGIMMIIPSVRRLINDLEEIQAINTHNSMLVTGITKINEDIERFNQQINALQIEYEKTYVALVDAYSLNIIPSTFRNMRVMMYVADYMATSRASLEEVLRHSRTDMALSQLNEQGESFILKNTELIGNLMAEAKADVGIIRQLRQTKADSETNALFARLINYYKNLNFVLQAATIHS